MLAVLWISIAFVLIVWLWPAIWRNGIRGKIDCFVDFPRHECDIGEAVPMTVTLVNRSLFPVPFIQVQFKLPRELSMSPDERKPQMSFATYLLMRGRVQVTFTLYGYRRGPVNLSDMFIRMHEGFGIRNAYVHDLPPSYISVRPKSKPLTGVDVSRAIDGNVLVDRLLFQDETMLKGVRPYQFGDPARHIAWRASARLGKTMTKQFFSSTNQDALLILNAQTSEPYWAQSKREPFESSCEFVMDIATRLEQRHAQIMFATNAVITGKKSTLSTIRMKRMEIASMLGHGQPMAAASLTPLLTQILRQPDRTPNQVWLFSAFETDEQKLLLEHLKRRGKQINLVRPIEVSEEQ